MRLLIVEDEKQICDMVAKSLYDAGYEVDTCYDGEEALECILSEEYDLIVLDLNLPGMDGMEILKELRQKNEETKVIILSARGQIADKVEGLDAGANDYLSKPFHLAELEARIRHSASADRRIPAVIRLSTHNPAQAGEPSAPDCVLTHLRNFLPVQVFTGSGS